MKRHEVAILMLGVFTVSFSVLTLETSLMRMFSVMYAYHYAFLAIAIAFAGLGLGGIMGYLALRARLQRGQFVILALACSIFALLISSFTIVITGATSPDLIFTSGLYFLSFMPAGLFLATAYRILAKYYNIAYGIDVIGASLGSIAVVTFLNGLSPIITVLFIGTILSIASIFLAFLSSKKAIIGAAVIVFFLVFIEQFSTALSTRDVPIGSDPNKELYNALNDPEIGARIEESRWSAFGRTDLVGFRNNTDLKAIYIDGGAPTRMFSFNGNFGDPGSAVYGLRFSTAAYPFYFSNKGSAMIIGAGGGVDVLTSLMFNFSHIYAVEINQETVNMVKDYSSYNGGIYTNYSNVHVYVDEGRSFLKRTSTKYDVIMLNIPITKAIQGTSGYSMAESYLFTVDSFKDYLNHLNDDGYLEIVAHNNVEIYKVVLTAIEALKRDGKSLSDIMNQMVVTVDPHHMSPVLVLKNTPFAPAETERMLEKSDELNFESFYFPYANSTQKQNLDQALVNLADGKMDPDTLVTAASSQGLDIRPPTDDIPFFYKFESGLPATLLPLLLGFSILTIAITIVYFLVGWNRLSLASKKVKRLRGEKFSSFMPYYFASLGLGFMLIEVFFVQKFILFIGSPTLAISTVLFSLLLSMGVGGLFSKKWKDQKGLILMPALLIGIITILYFFALPIVLDALLGLDLSARLIVSFAIIAPAGFLMGIPFPTGIRTMDQNFDSKDISWMWGINGLYSLLGSTFAIILAMSFGFGVTLLLGGASYLMIFLVGRAFFKKRRRVFRFLD